MQIDSDFSKQVFGKEKSVIFDKKASTFNAIFYKNMKASLLMNRFLKSLRHPLLGKLCLLFLTKRIHKRL